MENGFIEWAMARYGKSLYEIKTQFSMALLYVLYDAYWWLNIAPSVAKTPEKVPTNSGAKQVNAVDIPADQLMQMLTKNEV